MKQLRFFFVIASIICVLVFLAVLIAGIGLSIYGPLHPGNLLFPFQYLAERQMGIIYSRPEQRSAYYLDLLERRIRDLSFRSGTAFELIAIEYLNDTLDLASNALSSTTQNKSPNELNNRFNGLIFQLNDVINKLDVARGQNGAVFQKFQAKILSLMQMVQVPSAASQKQNVNTQGNINTSLSSQSATATPSSAPGLVPFPPGSVGAEHAFYPLIGQHGVIACIECHNRSVYLDTPKTCIACHMIVRPVPHYPGICEMCHTPVSWKEVHFDHTASKADDCISCHYMDRPAGHYQGQCSACHVIDAWDIISFNHAVAGAVDCVSCHAKDSPPDHYPGQCSRCHNTTDWKSVTFDHTGYTDCVSCHADKAPANHYPGQCSRCHNTSNWASVVFDHSGLADCASCHSSDAPANHYSGQCSQCHSTSTWLGAVFNHSGLTDCISCHDADAPAGHYPGQCSNCHSTGGSWKNAHFDHSGFTDCVSCHSGDAPANHYPGQCSNCHTPGTWKNAVFDHDGFTDCISCHLKDRPAEHDSGQCSECHNTQRWGDAGGNGFIGSFYNIYFGIPNVKCQSCHLNSSSHIIKEYSISYGFAEFNQY